MICVVNVGEVPKTATPVPVSSVNAPNRLAEENEPREVAFPTEVIAPVRFALVVTVAAFPVIEAIIGCVNVATLVLESYVMPVLVFPPRLPDIAV